MTVRRTDEDSGITYYFEPILNETTSPPEWVCVVTTIGDTRSRHQIGPVALSGATTHERLRESQRHLEATLRVYVI